MEPLLFCCLYDQHVLKVYCPDESDYWYWGMLNKGQ